MLQKSISVGLVLLKLVVLKTYKTKFPLSRMNIIKYFSAIRIRGGIKKFN